MSIFTEDNPSIFTEQAPLPEQADREVVATELILEGNPSQQDFQERLLEPISKETSTLAVEQNLKFKEEVNTQALNALEDGDAQKTAEAVQAVQAISELTPSKSDYEYGLLNRLGFKETGFDNPEAREDYLSDIQILKEKLRRETVLRTKINDLETEAGERSWVGVAADWLGTFGTGYSFYSAKGLGTEGAFENFWELPDTTTARLKFELDNIANPAEYDKAIESFFEASKSESGLIFRNIKSEIDKAEQILNEDNRNENFSLGMEAVFAGVTGVASGARAIKKIAKLTDTNLSAEITANAVKDLEKEVETAYTEVYKSKDSALDDVLPQEFKANLGDNPSFGKVLEKLNSLEPEFKGVLDLAKIEPLKEVELQDAKIALDTVVTRLGSKVVPIDSQIVGNPLSKVRDYVTLIGNKGGTQGFKTKSGAIARAEKQLGLKPEQYDIAVKDDGYFVRYKEVVDPARFTGTMDIGVAENISPIGRRLRSAKEYLSNTDDFLYADLQRSKIGTVLEKKLRPLNGLPKETKELYQKALNHNQKTDMWFETKEEFMVFAKERGVKYKPEDWNNYNLIRQANDVDWFMRNQKAYDELKAKNFKTLDLTNTSIADLFDSPRVTGRMLDDLDTLADKKVFNLETGELVAKGGLKDWDKLKAQGFRAFKVIDDSATNKLGKPEVFIIRGKGVKVNDLSYSQLGYRAGGRRTYKPSKYLIQQAGKSGANAATRYITDQTLDAQEYIDKMNGFNALYKTFLETGDEASAINKFEGLGINREWKGMKADVEGGILDIESEYKVIRKSDRLPRTNVDLSDELADLVETGSLYYSKRGNHLTDLHGKELETVDSMSVLDKALAQSVSTNTISQYTNRAMREWVGTAYGKNRPKGQTTSQLFNSHIDSIPNLNAKQKNAMLATREAINRFTTRQGDFAKWFEARKQSAAFALHEKYPKVFGKETTANMFDGSILSSNPINFLRGVTFHTTLGLFTPHNFAVQTGQAMMIAMTGGTNIGRHLGRGTLLATVGRTPHPAMRKLLKNKMNKGLDDDASDAFVDEWLESGLKDINDTVAYIDQTGPSSFLGMSKMRQATGKFMDYGLLPFNMTERLNRGTAFARAWDDLGYDKLGRKLTQEERVKLIGETDKYNMNMMSSRMSGFQTNIAAALPTQFYSYMVRLYEALAPAAIGGSVKWSGKEKIALWASLVGLYGSDGLAVPYSKNFYEGFTEELFGKDSTAKKVVDKGLIDSFFWIGGINSDFGARTGPRGQFQDLFDRTFEDDTTFLDMVGGATGGITYPLFKGLAVSSYIGLTESAEAGIMHGQHVLTNSISTTRNLNYMNQALETGRRVTKYGDLGVPISKAESLLLPLGVSTEGYYNANEQYKQNKKLLDLPKGELAKRISYFYKMALESEDGLESRRYVNAAEAALRIMDAPDSIKAKIRRKGRARADYYQQNLERYYQLHGKFPASYDAIMENYNEEE